MGIKDFLKEKRQERKQESAAKKIQKEKARAAYLREREKQEIETARWKAKQRGVAQRTVNKGTTTGGFMSFAQNYAKRTTGTNETL